MSKRKYISPDIIMDPLRFRLYLQWLIADEYAAIAQKKKMIDVLNKIIKTKRKLDHENLKTNAVGGVWTQN